MISAILFAALGLSLTTLFPAIYAYGGDYTLQNNNDKTLCITLLGEIASGTSLFVSQCSDGYDLAQWDLSYGTTTVKTRRFGLDAGKNPKAYTIPTLQPWNTSNPSQIWYYTNDNHIALQGAGLCLSGYIPSGPTSGSSMNLQPCNDPKSQTWNRVKSF